MTFIIESKAHGSHEVLIDDEDREKVLSHSWCLSKKGNFYYVIDRKSNVYLHRLLAGNNKGKVVDHIDGNSLNNHKSNLRECTHAENTRNRQRMNKNNTSGLKGVFWIKNASLWRAQIKVDRKIIYLGYFKDKIKAAFAYNEAATKYHGEFASFNGAFLCK